MRPAFANLVQLRQIVGEIVATGPASKKVAAEVSRLVGALGPELGILCDVPVSDIERAGGSLLAEAVTRLRRGAVVREAGYDGEYGKVALFAPGEIGAGPTLFDLAELELPAARPLAPRAAHARPAHAGAGHPRAAHARRLRVRPGPAAGPAPAHRARVPGQG